MAEARVWVVTATRVDGTALLAARVSAGMSRAELAAILGVGGARRVSLWERNFEQVNVQLIPAVAHALGVEPGALLAGPVDDLVALRMAAGLSQARLAQFVGMSTMAYARLEQGQVKSGPASDTLKALADALNATTATVTAAIECGRSQAP